MDLSACAPPPRPPRSWIGVEDPSLLGVKGTELLLVGAREDYHGGWPGTQAAGVTG